MKKLCASLIAIVVLLTASLTGCSFFDRSVKKWDFKHEAKEIEKIQIVEMSRETSHDYTVIKDIDPSLYETIYSEIQEIDWRWYYFELLSPMGTCFVIHFNNGDSDIISFVAPSHVVYEDDDAHYYTSWLECDQEEFEALINKYLN